MNYFVLNMLTMPMPDGVDFGGIAARAARLSCPDARFSAFAAEAGGSIGGVDDEEDARLRSEIDALVAIGYGLSADDLDIVFSDFTVAAVPLAYRELVRQAYGEFGGDR